MHFQKYMCALLIALCLSGCSKKKSASPSESDCTVSILASVSCDLAVAPQEVPLGPAETDDPSLIRALNGRYYLVFLSDRSGNNDLYISESIDGSSWGTPVAITSHADEDNYPILFQTSDSLFHLVWNRFSNTTFLSHLYYRQTSNPLAWGSSETPITSGVVDDQDAMALALSDSLFQIFLTSAQRSIGLGKPSYNRDIYFVNSTDQGATWSSPTLVDVSSTTESDRFPWVIRANNSFTVLFQRHTSDSPADPTADLFVSTSPDGSIWSAPVQLTSNGADNQPDLWASLHWSPLLSDWFLAYTSTAFSSGGGMIVSPLAQAGDSTSRRDFSATLGIGTAWSMRTAELANGLTLMVWVSNSTGTPRLWSAQQPF